MQKTRSAAVLALAVLLLSAAPVSAADRSQIRDRDRNVPGIESPIQRFIQAVRKLVKPLEEIIIPRP